MAPPTKTRTRAPAGAAALSTSSASATTAKHAAQRRLGTLTAVANTHRGGWLRRSRRVDVFIRHWFLADGLLSGALSGGGVTMELEARRLLDLAVHVKLASEIVLEVAMSLTGLPAGSASSGVGAGR